MTPEEFAAARQILGETDDQLAGTLGVTPDVIRAWSRGTARIPRRDAKYITFRVAAAERTAALKESGLPNCEWLLAHDVRSETDTTEELVRQAEGA